MQEAAPIKSTTITKKKRRPIHDMEKKIQLLVTRMDDQTHLLVSPWPIRHKICDRQMVLPNTDLYMS